MSPRSGIEADSQLVSIIGSLSCNNIRALKIVIKNERIVKDGECLIKGEFDHDYKNSVAELFDEKDCSYLVVRTDSPSQANKYSWLFIMYTPDKASVKDKTLYASTKATLRRMFPENFFKHEIHWSIKSETSFEGYTKQMSMFAAAAPLTMSEIEHMELKKQEAQRSLMEKADTLPGVTFPISEELESAFENFKSRRVNLVSIMINLSNEILELELCKNVSMSELTGIACNHSRYCLFRFNHTHEGKQQDSISNVFIYIMPGYSRSIKERMLYSACKSTLVAWLNNYYGDPVKVLEEESLANVTESFLLNEIHPAPPAKKEVFSKPKRPGRR